MKKKGYTVTASDKNVHAIQLTLYNAKKNNVTLPCIVSDLFSAVPETFDIILFNPPFGHTTKNIGILEKIKSFLPRENTLIEHLSFPFIRKQRRKLLQEFFKEAPKHLTSKGNIFLLIRKEELPSVPSHKIISTHRLMQLISIQRKNLLK